MAISKQLQDEIKTIDAAIRDGKNANRLEHNRKMLEIFEGNLLPYVDEALKEQLSAKAYESAKHRIVAINVSPKVVGKLSQCYTPPPVRVVHGLDDAKAGDKEQKLWQWLETQMAVNEAGVTANEYLNLFKNGAYEPFLDGKKPSLRVLPSDRFFVYSFDRTNPLKMTHFVKIMGQVRDKDGKERTLYFVYTDFEIAAFYSEGTIADDVMAAYQMDGKNPYGKIPFVYFARSKVDLIPQIDTDTLSMTILLPILLTDLAFALMFLSFGMTWVKNGTIDGAVAPNAVLHLKSDGNSDHDVDIGTVKPEVDSDKALAFIKSVLTFWLEARNIKAAALGAITTSNYASGIAKFLDEMDTSADRQKQVPFLKTADQALGELVLNHMHPVWMKTQGYEKPVMPAKGCTVKSTFAEQRPIIDPSVQIADQEKLLAMGLESKRGALKTLHPDWTDKQIDAKLAEIEAEKPEQDPEHKPELTEEVAADDKKAKEEPEVATEETEEVEAAS